MTRPLLAAWVLLDLRWQAELTVKARETLRGEVAALAVKGAEQILKREVDQAAHADLLNQLKAEL